MVDPSDFCTDANTHRASQAALPWIKHKSLPKLH